MYRPPFSISSRMLTLSISITEKLGRLTGFQSLSRMPVLRRNNSIRSVHSSLAIEGNPLSLDQVVDVIADKPVVGRQKEIQEVKNAYKAYGLIRDFDGYSEQDLLKAHEILTYLTDEEPGRYRNHGAGVTDGNRIVFVAPPYEMVPKLMHDLFAWLKNDEETPLLIKSCVFHYEFVFIHPFNAGNGRTARLWQNVLLTKWNPLFEYIPIESQIMKCQTKYYEAIAASHKAGRLDAFIGFMLEMIDGTLRDVVEGVERESKNISEQVNRLLGVMEKDIPLSANEIMERLGIKSKETLRGSYLNPALENGLIRMTIPDKTKSKNQRYVK